jgi:hypothetical protein
MTRKHKRKTQESKKLYDLVKENFLKRKQECFVTRINTGIKYVGRVDAIGIRDIGGISCGDIEIIAVEVKPKKRNIINQLGQALGYSLIAHKCYLAVNFKHRESFTQEDKFLASRLGVGLLEIRGKGIKEALSAPKHEPVENLVRELLWNLNVVKCNICGTFVKGAHKKAFRLINAFNKEKVFMWNTPVEHRKILFPKESGNFKWASTCPACVNTLVEELKKALE